MVQKGLLTNMGDTDLSIKNIKNKLTSTITSTLFSELRTGRSLNVDYNSLYTFARVTVTYM